MPDVNAEVLLLEGKKKGYQWGWCQSVDLVDQYDLLVHACSLWSSMVNKFHRFPHTVHERHD